jgi:hypothetical protein
MKDIYKQEVLDHAEELGIVGATTWGDIYHKMERYRLKGWSSIIMSFFFLFSSLLFIYHGAYILAIPAFGLCAYYFRNYIGMYSNYMGLWGYRRAMVPNLKGKTV